MVQTFLDPMVLGLWIGVGLVAGYIGEKIFHAGRHRGGGGFGDLLKTAFTGMLGAVLGIVVGQLLGVPGADRLGLPMLLLAVAGTLLLMFLSSRLA